MDNRPIGVFDSGLGGLTVVKEINRLLPNESIVYFGDSGRAPYGTKSKETVVKFTLQDIRFLLSRDVKLIVIACNTISACAYDEVIKRYTLPIMEVINPGALAAVRATKINRVGIIGTNATINSDVYNKAIKKKDNDIITISKPCPLFVPLAEEGWWNSEISELIAKKYLEEFIDKKVDTLVLGCTHYPLLQETINKVMGEKVSLVSSAYELAKALSEKLCELELFAEDSNIVKKEFFTSDCVEKFLELGGLILGEELKTVKNIDIESY